MRTVWWASILLTALVIDLPAASDEISDLAELASIYEDDQAARSKENMEKGLAPTLQEERDRRFSVFQYISEGRLHTANDFFRAGLVLHHTGSIGYDDGHMESLGIESKLLAFFLFRRAHNLGHERGRVFMAAAYNYYLDECGEDAGKFGYKFENGQEVWRPDTVGAESEIVKCGFDPLPYFKALEIR